MLIHRLSNWEMFLIFIFPSFFVNGQTAIPDAVKDAFYERFPNADYVEWEQDGEEFYAYFTYGERDVEAYFFKTGKWLQTNTFQEFTDLPVSVQDYLTSKYPDTYYSSMMKLTTPTDTKISIQFETETDFLNLTFSESGELLSTDY